MDFSELLADMQNLRNKETTQQDGDELVVKPDQNSVSWEQRRRASLLSQREMKFVYSTASGLLHDRDCGFVRHIADQNFDMRQDYTVDGKWCPRCYRAALIRNALVLDETKRIRAYLNRLNVLQAKNADLYRLFVRCGATLYKIDTELVYLKLVEDRWAFGTDSEKCLLFHNNYYETEDHRRVMTKGFHPQRIGEIETFHFAAKIVCEYNYETHLHRQRKEEQAAK